MRLGSRLIVLCSLIRDTFRQSVASGICWLMLGVSGLSIAVCLSVEIVGASTIHRSGERSDFLPRSDPDLDPRKTKAEGIDVVGGEMRLAFGAVSVPLGRDARDAVRYLQLILAGVIADTAGVLLTLIWTAAFLPGFLQPRAVSVLLAKPVSRSVLLTGKYLGVLTFVFLQATVFVVGTWLALGIRTGTWDAAYLLCIPMLLLHFAIFFSFSCLLAVCTRSTIVCVLGSLVFWFLCWGMNFGRHAVVAAPYISPENTYSPLIRTMVEIGYWILPKPGDLGVMLFESLGAGKFFGGMGTFEVVADHGQFFPGLSVVSSLLYTAFLLFAAVRQFEATDY